MTKLIVLGSTGLLGNTLLKYFSTQTHIKCYGIIRKNSDFSKLKSIKNVKLYKIDYKKKNSILKVFNKIKPNLIINCIGVIKQLTHKNQLSEIIKINSHLPHYLTELANIKSKTRFIQFSTDCVFSGTKGKYKETDYPCAQDIYGRSKLLGELTYPNTLTLRTSIIGHELQTKYSLLSWFLDQNKPIKGYKNAIFSGLTALEIAKFLDKFIIPNKKLEGMYHLSGNTISKYELLNLVKSVYKKDIKIIIDKKVKINRSLNSNLLQKQTGYKPPNWITLIQEMFEFYMYK